MAKARRKGPAGLPCPGAEEPEGFLQRLEGLQAVWARRRARLEGAGQQFGVGRGQEFVGYRPYRGGEDARALDHALLARLGRPFVRVTRPEAHHAVAILLDRSPSMGVGPPGKWQTAVELTLACAHLFLVAGAEVHIHHGTRDGGPKGLAPKLEKLQRIADWAPAKDRLFALTCEEGLDPKDLLPSVARRCDHVFVFSDLFGLEPRDLQPLLQARTTLTLVRILSHWETQPPPGQPILWVDAEDPSRRVHSAGQADRSAYLEHLGQDAAVWQEFCGLHRITWKEILAGTPFEECIQAGGLGV